MMVIVILILILLTLLFGAGVVKGVLKGAVALILGGILLLVCIGLVASNFRNDAYPSYDDFSRSEVNATALIVGENRIRNYTLPPEAKPVFDQIWVSWSSGVPVACGIVNWTTLQGKRERVHFFSSDEQTLLESAATVEEWPRLWSKYCGQRETETDDNAR